ncbi:aspartyl/asparaginyl beta-hydroxylase domain-containing protein, partial [Sphingorhabdus sp.]
MKINQPLLKLPLRIDADRLSAEISALPISAWLPHPGKVVGNDAVPLITPNGVITNAFAGPMAATEHLRACPYILDIMRNIGAVWGRSRLMGLAAGAVVPEHVDVGHYWRTHFRIHIPVITNPKVVFTCEGEMVNMAAGECWIFDSFRTHDVYNGGSDKRIHLVLDTVGGERLWDLIRSAESEGEDQVETIVSGSAAHAQIRYEQVNTPEIMSVWEVRCHVDFLLDQAPRSEPFAKVIEILDRFLHHWGALWAQYGTSREG